MPNVGEVLKSEIVRLSKKTARAQVQPLLAALHQQKKQLILVRAQVANLQRELVKLRRSVPKPQVAPDSDSKNRVTAKGLRSLRSRLGLSREEFAQLLSVSGQTIYNWETKGTSPRPEQVAAIVLLRTIGKREARARLSELSHD